MHVNVEYTEEGLRDAGITADILARDIEVFLEPFEGEMETQGTEITLLFNGAEGNRLIVTNANGALREEIETSLKIASIAIEPEFSQGFSSPPDDAGLPFGNGSIL